MYEQGGEDHEAEDCYQVEIADEKTDSNIGNFYANPIYVGAEHIGWGDGIYYN